jgi:group I intron endonuclease
MGKDTYSIYRIYNEKSGKSYIGQTKHSIERRFREHCNPSSKCRLIRRAIQKHGEANFDLQLLYTTDSVHMSNIAEQAAIKHFNSMVPNGYNLNTGGYNKVVSENTKQLMRDNYKKLPQEEKDRRQANRKLWPRKPNTNDIRKQRSAEEKAKLNARKARENQFKIYKASQRRKSVKTSVSSDSYNLYGRTYTL